MGFIELNGKREDSRYGRQSNEDTLLTAQEAANYLRLSLGTVYNLVSKGRLRPGRAGNRLRFRREDLDRFLWGIGGKEE